MRTSRTKAVLTRALLTATMLGTGFLFTTSPVSAAGSPYSAAVAECLAGTTGGVALRECLLAVAPRRTPRVVEPSETSTSTSASRPAVSSAKDARAEESAPAAPVAETAPANDAGSDSDTWSQLRECEASGDYGLNDGSGYYGAYQFDLSTWQSIGYAGYPHQASPAVQDEAARVLQSQRGWQPWPACSRKLGLR